MENNYSSFSFISPSCNGDNQGNNIRTYHSEKKLKLFGIVLHTPQNTHKGNNVEECNESVNSSSSSTILSSRELQGEKISKDSSSSTTEPAAAPPSDENNKFVCHYCKKRFPNSQALGGHQNAHKKERMKKKRLQLQARKASINYYLQPNKNNPSLINHHIVSSPWLYNNNPSNIITNNIQAHNGFIMHDESHISFGQSDQDKWYIPFERQDSNMFSFTHKDHKTQVLMKHSNFTSPMKNSKALDLQLGLSLSSISEM